MSKNGETERMRGFFCAIGRQALFFVLIVIYMLLEFIGLLVTLSVYTVKGVTCLIRAVSGKRRNTCDKEISDGRETVE